MSGVQAGRVAVITGGSAGIGLATASRFLTGDANGISGCDLQVDPGSGQN